MFKGSTQTEDGRSDVSRWHRVTKVVFWLMIHAALVRCHPNRIACSSPHKSPTSFPKRGLDMAGRTRGERASELPKPLLLIPAFNFLKDKYFNQVDREHRFASTSTFPSRLDKPEQVKKKRAWNGMEATPFVPSFFLPPSPSLPPSLAHNAPCVCMARTERAVDERTQRRRPRPSDREAESRAGLEGLARPSCSLRFSSLCSGSIFRTRWI